MIGMVVTDSLSKVSGMCWAQDHGRPQTKRANIDASHDNATLQEPILHRVSGFRILTIEGDSCTETANIGNVATVASSVAQFDLKEG